LSSRRKVKEEKKQEPAKTPKAKPARPTGKAPEAMVTSRHGTGFVTRLGKGFSSGELAGAGLSPKLASDWGARLDLRRRSVVDSNVASLKSWGTHPGTAKRTESRVKEVEEEIEKVGREVKKEAVKVEKEAVKVGKEAEKVEREVKEEAVKAEKAVRRKPKPKPKKKADS
jgi:ribosomal protein L13E